MRIGDQLLSGPNNLQLFGLDLADFKDGGISLPPLAIDALDAFNIAFPNGDVAFHALIGTLSKSVFAQGTLTVTDWLALTLGARYQDEKRSIIRSDSGLYLSDGGFKTLFNWNRIGARDGNGDPFPTDDTTTSFRLFGRNLADEKYSQGLIATDFGANVTLAAPATYGLRLNWEF